MNSPPPFMLGLAAACCLAGPFIGSAQAASAYTQPWSGATTEGWEANTISSVVVHDAALGNPAGSIASRYDNRQASFDIGFTSGNVAATSGSFAATPWTVSFDLQLNEGKFSDVWLRYRYQDFTYNGWRHALPGPFDEYNLWTNYAVSFDPAWSDAQAMANGWTQDIGPVVSFAQTMSNVYKTEVRLALTDSASSAFVHLDNFVQTPVPEPQTWALLLGGLLMMGTLARRRPR